MTFLLGKISPGRFAVTLTLDLSAVFHGFRQFQDHSAVRRSGWCSDMGALMKHRRYRFGNLGGE